MHYCTQTRYMNCARNTGCVPKRRKMGSFSRNFGRGVCITGAAARQFHYEKLYSYIPVERVMTSKIPSIYLGVEALASSLDFGRESAEELLTALEKEVKNLTPSERDD